MPNVPTYVRKEDYDKYVAIQSQAGAWAEFIHNALHQTTDEYVAKKIKDAIKPIKTPKVVSIPSVHGSSFPVTQPPKLSHQTNNPIQIKTPKDAERILGQIDTKIKLQSAVKLCKIHGTPLDDRGFCLVKGCKYGPK